MDELKQLDRKDLIAESYRIKGISEPECRSIFLDWALSLPDDWPAPRAAERMLQHYAGDNPDHPMTRVLQQAGSTAPATGRRGGRTARLNGTG